MMLNRVKKKRVIIDLLGSLIVIRYDSLKSCGAHKIITTTTTTARQQRTIRDRKKNFTNSLSY